MDVTELAPGLWRWTGYHEEWQDVVGSVYCETDEGVVLIDPLVPPEDTDRFWQALDRDVAKAGGEVHVLLTVFWHLRSSGTRVDRYGARTWVPTAARAPVVRRSVEVSDPFRPDDQLPGGLEAFRTARSTEVVYWLPRQRTLVPGDVLLGGEDGGVRLCPQSWLPAKTSLRELADSLRPLLELPVERILVSHGEPVLGDGRSALAEALA
jgi:glyoxylase-like metal-dependent hydrolase (beta-lactamase superfamily II)